MGRKSVLTPEQWAEIERRHLVGGESINSLAKEFGVNEGTIRKKINPNKSEQPKAGKTVSELAREKVEADKRVKDISEKIAELPIVRQQIVNELARKLTNVSEHLASAAEHSAASAHRLSILANQQLEKVDDVNPMANITELNAALALQKMANVSSEIGVNLMRANKDTIDELTRRGVDPETGSGVAIYELPNNGRG
jgi:transposase-like protein